MTPFGIVKDVNQLEERNASLPIDLISEPIVAVAKTVHPLKALFPIEGNESHYINDDNCDRNNKEEDWLHPVFDLQALAGVGFSNELFPAPAISLEAAEQNKYQRANGKQVCGYDEILLRRAGI